MCSGQRSVPAVTHFTPLLLLEACCRPTVPAAAIVHPALPQAPCFSSGVASSELSPPGCLQESFRGLKEKALLGSAVTLPFGTKAQTCATAPPSCSHLGAQPTGSLRIPRAPQRAPHFHSPVPPLPYVPLSPHYFNSHVPTSSFPVSYVHGA